MTFQMEVREAGVQYLMRNSHPNGVSLSRGSSFSLKIPAIPHELIPFVTFDSMSDSLISALQRVVLQILWRNSGRRTRYGFSGRISSASRDLTIWKKSCIGVKLTMFLSKSHRPRSLETMLSPFCAPYSPTASTEAVIALTTFIDFFQSGFIEIFLVDLPPRKRIHSCIILTSRRGGILRNRWYIS